MKEKIRKLEIFILLMLFWLILNEGASLRLIAFGCVFSYFIIRITYPILFGRDNSLIRMPHSWRFLWFIGIVGIAIVKSSIVHSIRILKNEAYYKVFTVDLETDNVLILTLISNAITMTPGTITIGLEGQTLEVVGFAKTSEDVEEMKAEIQGYFKPFRI